MYIISNKDIAGDSLNPKILISIKENPKKVLKLANLDLVLELQNFSKALKFFKTNKDIAESIEINFYGKDGIYSKFKCYERILDICLLSISPVIDKKFDKK